MHPREGAETTLGRFGPMVDEAIGRALAGRPDVLLYEMVRYHLGLEGGRATNRSGKRVRAAICLLACEAAAGRAEAAAPAAAAVELMHSFTLLHDDIADGDEVRRGRPTVWRRWGVGQGVTAGDALFALANIAAAQLVASPATVQRVLAELNEAVLSVCEGQQLDISFEGRSDLTVADYLGMIERKTSALFAAACSIGARVAGAADERRAALAEFGREVGLGFQIRDDLLGIWGDASEMGKPVGSDLRRNKRSLPVLHAINAAGGSRIAARLTRGVPTDQEAVELAQMLAEAGARQFCEQQAHECLGRGLAALAKAEPEPSAAEELRTLAGFLIERSS
ncbi:MAG: polyprenyl synthetase family protein [Armatimonadota bacterium]